MEPDHLEIRVLGRPKALYRGEPLLASTSKPISFKTLVLICYLAVEGRPVSRQEISDQLWPGQDDANLRMALSQLRACRGSQRWLVDDGALSIRAITDLAQFQNALEANEHLRSLELWGNAHDPQSHLLAGFEHRQLPADFIDLWLVPRREDTFRQYLGALFQSAFDLELQGDELGAMGMARILTRHLPLHESGYQQLLRLHYRRGEYHEAVSQFELFQRVLRERGLPRPLPGTLALAQHARGTEGAGGGEAARPGRPARQLGDVLNALRGA